MASITCGNGHKHGSVLEVKQCYGLVARPAAPPTVSYPRGYAAVDLVTAKQIQYATDLGGSPDHVKRLTKAEASAYIKGLLNGTEKRVSTPKTGPFKGVPPEGATSDEDDAPMVDSKKTTKTDMILGLLDMVPDAYYAVQRSEGERVHFLRVKRPVHGKMKGCVKVQSQHGPSLENRWVLWPSGYVSRYHYPFGDIEDALLLLMADWQGATKRYAEKMKRCGRCNTKLTDPRSRFYLLGPECETKAGWGWWIDEVAERMGGYWEQQPPAVQEKYLPEYDDARTV
jgi:hypothetical protein